MNYLDQATDTARAEQLLNMLIEVRERIEGGWTRKAFTQVINGQTHYCAVGAVRTASRGRWQGSEEELAHLLAREIGVVNLVKGAAESALIRWNDTQVTDKRTILRVIDRAIKRQEPVALTARARLDAYKAH